MNNTHSTPLSTRASLIAFLFSLFIFNSCKDDLNNVGIGIQPEEDFLTVTLDTLEFNVSMYRADSLSVTQGVVFPQIGTYTDPDFGVTKNVFYTQFDLPGANLDLGNPDSLEVDSVVLVVTTTQRHYGSLIPQEMLISELAEDYFEDSTYYSNTNLAVLGGNLIAPGSELTTVSNAGLFTYGDSIYSEINFKLDNALGDRFLDQSGETPFNSDEDFQEFFKGVSLESVSEDGALISIFPSASNAGIFVYYRDNGVVLDTLSVFFPMNNESSFSATTHDYSSTTFGDFSTPISGAENIYLQGVEGVLAGVEISNIATLETTDLSAVNRAELIIPVVPNSTLNYSPPSVIYLLANYTAEESEFVADMCNGLAIGGLYDEDENAYVFNMSLHLGEMIKGEVLPEFWLSTNIPDNIEIESACESQLIQAGILFPSFIEERRVILCGPDYSPQDESQNMRINITYSE